MRRLLFVTQQVDPAHPALAATIPKIRALAGLVDEVVVLADGAVDGVLPENCRVRTFRAGTRAVRGARFEAALATQLPGLRGGAVVAHMCPIYAVLAAPLVRPLRIPLLLWFTHWKASRLLRAAERVSTAVVSVDRRSFPIDSRKVRAIGHGIDLSEFPCVGERHTRYGRKLLLKFEEPAIKLRRYDIRPFLWLCKDRQYAGRCSLGRFCTVAAHASEFLVTRVVLEKADHTPYGRKPDVVDHQHTADTQKSRRVVAIE